MAQTIKWTSTTAAESSIWTISMPSSNITIDSCGPSIYSPKPDKYKKSCKRCGGWGWSDTNSCEFCDSALN